MDADAVVTPPYVAGPLRLSPFRALRLAPGRVGDPASARAFARPAGSVERRLAQWQARGELSQDDRPAVYLHEYTADGITVRGLVGALDVSRRAARAEDRSILPHEGIHPAQVEDLADRMWALQVNPAPILLVHHATAHARDLLKQVVAAPADHDFADRLGQQHRVWSLRAPELLDQLDTELAGARALIADGHHRYAAYLQLQRRHPGSAADHGLAMLVDHGETPLQLGAIHRVLVDVDAERLRHAVTNDLGRLQESAASDAVAALAPDTLVVTDGHRWHRLTLEVPPDRAAVEILHDTVLPRLPGVGPGVRYHHSVESALGHLRPGRDLAVLMPAPTVELVERIVTADRLLPEKATSFQPKPSGGVLIRSMLDAAAGPR